MVLAVPVLASISFGYDNITYIVGDYSPDWNPSGIIDLGTRYDRVDFEPITQVYGIQINIKYWDEGDTPVEILMFEGGPSGEPIGYSYGGGCTNIIRGNSIMPTQGVVDVIFGSPWTIPDDVESFWIIVINSSPNYLQHVRPRVCNGQYPQEDQSFYNGGSGWTYFGLGSGETRYRNFRIKVYVDFEFQSLTSTTWGSIKASF
jgi:hypothetical protein